MPKQPFKRKSLLALSTLLVLTLFLAGCSAGTTNESNQPTTPGPQPADQGTAPEPSGPNGTTEPAEHPVTLTLYFPNQDASALIPVERTVNIPDQATIKATFQELAKPPAGAYNPLPEGTKLLGAKVEGGIATVDLSREFQQNFGGGTAGEQMTLYSIVNSLTTLPNITGVQFLLEGEKQEAILGHADTTKPITRNENIIQK